MIARSFQRLKRFRIPLSTKENEIVNFSEKKWVELEKYYTDFDNLDPETQMSHFVICGS